MYRMHWTITTWSPVPWTISTARRTAWCGRPSASLPACYLMATKMCRLVKHHQLFSPINSCKFKKDTFTVYCLFWQYICILCIFFTEKRGEFKKKISIWHRLAQWFNCIEETFFFHNTKRKQEKSDGSNLICISWNHGLSFLQNSLIAYFTGTREETFFFAIKSRIHMSALATREK